MSGVRWFHGLQSRPDEDEVVDDVDDDDEEGFARVAKEGTSAREDGKDVVEARTSHVEWNVHHTSPAQLGHVRWRKRRSKWTSETVGSRDLACMVRRETKRNETKRRGGTDGADGRRACVRLLEWIAKRVYPTSEATCAPGQYYDPNAGACVFVCQEGYYYDPETRSCKKVRDVQTNLRPVEQYATRSQAVAKWNLRQALARAMANALLGDRFRNKSAAENCAVGFYFDPVTKSCVPLCGHGYVYDKIRKECVPEDGRTKHRS